MISFIFVAAFFLYFLIVCEIRKPLQKYRNLSREMEKDLHNLCPFHKGVEPTYLDQLWTNFLK